MCGLIGLTGDNKELLAKAAKTFDYRGPDAFGSFSDSHMTLGLNRLAIVDIDPRSNQPFVDVTGNYVISYNGELYNYTNLREELEKKYNFRTTSDTEVLLYGYIEYGVEIFSKVEGMFGVAIYDKAKGQVVLGRDHRGIKPLLYYFNNEDLFFSSEIKGIIKILKEKNISFEIDNEAVDLYWSLGYIPEPFSLYKDIKKLPRQSYMIYHVDTKKLQAPVKYSLPTSQVNSKADFVKLLEKKVLNHIEADVPVGVFFSGGTDSSLIAAILHKYKKDLETFSIKVSYKTEDYKYFRKIAEHLKLKNSEYVFETKEFDDVYEEIMLKIDDPTYDNSIFPTYFVSKKASEKVKVVLSGEGGDEFFSGYHRSLYLNKMKNSWFDNHVNILDWFYIHLPSFKSKNFLFERLNRSLRLPTSYYILSMSPSRDQMSWASFCKIKKYIISKNLKPLEYDQELYLENDLLRKTDLATSYASLEGRVPLLDYEVLSASEKFGDEKLKDGVLKSFLKSILSEYIPEDLVYRSKSGFGLGLPVFFKESKFLSSDLNNAISFLKQENLLNIKSSDVNNLVNKYPNLGFAIITLYRSIINTRF